MHYHGDCDNELKRGIPRLSDKSSLSPLSLGWGVLSPDNGGWFFHDSEIKVIFERVVEL